MAITVHGVTIGLNVMEGKIQCGVYGFGDEFDDPMGTTMLDTNTWYHAAYTYDGEQGILYLNGEPEDTVISSSVRMDKNSKVYFGVFHNPLTLNYSSGFIGYIDEARIWDTCLTRSEIQNAMNIRLRGDTIPEIIGYWTMDEGSGTTINNMKEDGSMGIISDATWCDSVPFGRVPGKYDYDWSSGDTTRFLTVAAIESSYFKVDINKGTYSGTDSVFIRVNSLPEINAGSDQEICFGDSVILTADGEGEYTWLDSIEDGMAFLPLTTKEYYVESKNEFNCSSRDTVKIIVRDCKSFVDLDFSDSVICFGDTSSIWAGYFHNLHSLEFSGNEHVLIPDGDNSLDSDKSFSMEA